MIEFTCKACSKEYKIKRVIHPNQEKLCPFCMADLPQFMADLYVKFRSMNASISDILDFLGDQYVKWKHGDMPDKPVIQKKKP